MTLHVGWLADKASAVGGAELTQAEFRDAAPDGVEIVDCVPGRVIEGLDRYVIHNCVTYSEDDLRTATETQAVKYWHDVGPWLSDEKHAILRDATAICCSPVQAEYLNAHAVLIPPPVDLGKFEKAAESVNGNRRGSVSVGSWRNYGKAPHRAAEWAEEHGIDLDFYGSGHWAPQGSQTVDYDDMPALLARYERFVFLPLVLEPFGRLVAEAWAAGCEVITNELVGAKYWIENDPAAISTAAEDFWKVVALANE